MTYNDPVDSGQNAKRRAMQIYLVCLTLSVAWDTYLPGFAFAIVVPMLIGFHFLESAYPKPKARWIGLGLFIPTSILAFAIHAWNLPIQSVTASQLPPYLTSFESESRGKISIPIPPDDVDTHPFGQYWIHAPVSTVTSLLENNGTKGKGFDSNTHGCISHVNFETSESWNVYAGKRTLPEFPALTNSLVHAGSERDWTTLVYRSPARS